MPDKPARHFGEVAATLQRAAGERSADSAHHLRSTQTLIHAIERGDFEALIRDAHEEVTLDIFAPPQFPFIANAHGKSEFLAAVSHNFAAIEDQTPQIRDIFAEGDTVVLFGRERGKVRQTGVGYDVEFVERLTFSDGKLASVRIIVADVKK